MNRFPYHKNIKLKSKRISSLNYIASPNSREWAIRDYKDRLYKEWEKHFFGTMPEEVYQVWMMGMSPFVSTEYYRLKEIAVRKWPAWFPWEVTYNAIPKEVHEAYGVNFEWMAFESFNQVAEDSETGGRGLMTLINEAPSISYEKKPFTMAYFDEIVNKFQEQREKQREAEKEKEKADKALWNKYYKPYGLKYKG